MTQPKLPASADSLSSDALKTVTRADLAEAVHLHTGLGRTDCAKYVEMVLDEIFEAIVTRKDVKLSSFGAFQIRAKREHQGRNPKTGQEAKITARLVVTFKPSNVLRARVNSDFAVPAPTKKATRSNGAAKPQSGGKSIGSGGLPGVQLSAKPNGVGAAR
jgi:integration host factor subunit alpha